MKYKVNEDEWQVAFCVCFEVFIFDTYEKSSYRDPVDTDRAEEAMTGCPVYAIYRD